MKKLKLSGINNENGSAIIMAIFISIGLSLAVFMALDSSHTNSQLMRSSRTYRDNLYKSESIISVAKEVHNVTWLDPASNLFDPTTDYLGVANYQNLTKLQAGDFPLFSNYPAGLVDVNNNLTIITDAGGTRTAIGLCEVARIELLPLGVNADGSDDTTITTLSERFPRLKHNVPPPIGSGASATQFEIRRYGMNAIAENNAMTVQVGLYKFFNK